MSDMDTIKARIRKLMAVAGDGVATDGEIDNAMRLAAKLLDAHHLTSDDVADPTSNDTTMGRSFATSLRWRFSTWEWALASAIADLFGCVQVYLSHDTQPIRVNGIAEMDDKGQLKVGRKVAFYGPTTESAEAADLFNEWVRSIATMGVARWGGCFMGDGAMYCMGFASALRAKVRKIDGERQLIAAKPLPMLPGVSHTGTEITLATRYTALRQMGKQWLENDLKLKLGKGRASVGYRSGDSGAYAEGHQHGTSAQFSRQQRRRQLPGA